MKRVLCILVLLSLLLCGCGDNVAAKSEKEAKNQQSAEEVIITEASDDTVNGYRTEYKSEEPTFVKSTEADEIQSGNVYYANKSTKKFHSASCKSVSTISEKNLYICKDRNELINSGFVPCKACNP